MITTIHKEVNMFTLSLLNQTKRVIKVQSLIVLKFHHVGLIPGQVIPHCTPHIVVTQQSDFLQLEMTSLILDSVESGCHVQWH